MTDPHDPRLTMDLGPAADGPSDHGQEFWHQPPATSAARRHVTDYLRVVYRRRKIMLLIFAVVMIATVVHTYTRVPIYEARAKLLIESTDPQYVGYQKVVDERTGGNEYYQTQYDLLKSRSLARRTLETGRLWERFGAGPAAEAASATADAPAPGWGTKLRGWLSWAMGREQPQPPAEEFAPAETKAQRAAINRLLAGLVVSPLPRSRIVDLKYRSPNPDLATVAVNAHAKAFIEQNMEFKFTASKEASEWLNERLTEQRKQVESASTALQQYQEQNNAVVAADDSDNIVIRRLNDVSQAVTRAKTLRLEKEAIYNQLRAIEQNAAALESYPAILSNAMVQQLQSELAQIQRRRLDLSQTYLDTHPEMQTLAKQAEAVQARLRGEVAKVVQGVRNEYLAAVAQEQSLSQALSEQKSEALAMNRKAIEFGVLNRELESTRSVYQSLLQRAQETGVAGELRTSNVRLIDVAERPAFPAYPNSRAALRRGVLWGLGLAIVFAFFFEYLDNRIRTPEEIEAHLKLPSLGLLPIAAGGKDADAIALREQASPRFVESVRTLRANVVFSTADTGCRSIIVTSTGPGEGKTSVSSNLAVSLAETGARVLTIDADMRKPRLHTTFGLAQEPGLSNLIVGTAKAREVVLETGRANLWCVPAGRIPPNAAELLGSSRFREFLASLRKEFDWVIIDTPPVMAVADAPVISRWASGVIFVIGAEMVSRPHALVALRQLHRAQARLLGAVLNKVDVDRNLHYYSPYYKAEYVDYYQKAGSARSAERV